MRRARTNPHAPQTRRVRAHDGSSTGEEFVCDALFTGYANLVLFTSVHAYRRFSSFALRSAPRADPPRRNGLAVEA